MVSETLPTLAPLPGYIVVERLEDPADPSGIAVAEANREKPQRGKVLFVWDNTQPHVDGLPPLHLAVGDEILFRKYGPAEVEISGVKLLLLEQADVYAKLIPANS